MKPDTGDRKVTVLPQVPVKYGWQQPSMSRRGGVRLRPSDGIIPYGENLYHIRRRDIAGNRLVDVTDPMSGFCIGVTSALESRPNNDLTVRPGVSGAHNTATRNGSAVRVESPKGRVYHEPWEDGIVQARVFRTTDMGDALLPVARVSKPATERKKGRTVKPSGRTGDTPAPTTPALPGGTGKDGRITKADCEAYLRVMMKGRNIPITKEMLALAKQAIKDRQAQMIKKNR